MPHRAPYPGRSFGANGHLLKPGGAARVRMSHATHNALLTTTAIVAAAYAVAFLVAPAQFLDLFGMANGAATVWVARLLGAAALGFAAIAFFSRRVVEVEARRALDAGFLIGWAATLGIGMWAQYLAVMNALGWITVAVSGAFAVSYFWFLAREDMELDEMEPART